MADSKARKRSEQKRGEEDNQSSGVLTLWDFELDFIADTGLKGIFDRYKTFGFLLSDAKV